MDVRVNRWRRIGFFCGRYFVDYKSNIDGMRIVLIAVFLTNHRRKSWFNRSFFSRRIFAG